MVVEQGREGKGREGKGREGKEGKERKGRESGVAETRGRSWQSSEGRRAEQSYLPLHYAA